MIDQQLHRQCDSEKLNELLLGRLSNEEEAAIESHLSQCRSCAEQIQLAAVPGTSWDEAQSMLALDEFDGQPSMSSHSSPFPLDMPDREYPSTTAMLTREIQGWLDPTDDPQMLGRFAGYEIVGIIGHGGMGIVLKGFETSLNRYVAIKVLAPRLASNGSARQRFSREAQAAAAVLHENVVAIHRVDKFHGLPFLVMPYVAGISLQTRIDDEGPLRTTAVLRIGSQIAAGLAAAHHQGLVHRDIKPANILLDKGVERVTITDFGLARAMDDATVTRTGIIAGTPEYMSPEQAQAKPLDARSDLFSLGSVLYAICTGRPPFRAETSHAVMRRITDEDSRPIPDINPDIPEWLCQIINSLMSKRADDRFESASEVAELFEGCLAHVQQPTVVPLPKRCTAGSLPVSRQAIGRFLRRPWTIVQWLVTTAFFAFVLVFVGVLISIELNKGTLTIECEADDVPVKITQGDKVVEKLTVDRTGTSVRIAAGKYVVEIDGEADGITIKDGIVELQRRGQRIVRVVLDQTPQTADSRNRDRNPLKLHGNRRSYMLQFSGRHKTHMVIPKLRYDGTHPITFEATVMSLYRGSIIGDFNGSGLGLSVADGFCTFHVNDGRAADNGYASITSRTRTRYRVTTGHEKPVHIAGVLDGNELRLFVDGKLEGTESIGEFNKSKFPFMIGADPGGQGEPTSFLNGIIDEVRVSKTARYNEDFSPPSKLKSDDHTMVLYRFDEGEGDVANDVSGNALHAKIHSAQWVMAQNVPVLTPTTLPGHVNHVNSVVFSPDGKLLAAGDAAGTVFLWELSTQRKLRTLNNIQVIQCVDFSPDGKTLVTADRGHAIAFWAVETGREIKRLREHTSVIMSVTYSPEGEMLASAGVDNTIRIWDSASGKVRATLSGHQNAIQEVVFSPDETKLASVDLDGALKIWDPVDGKLLMTYQVERSGMGLTFAPDGKILATANYPARIQLLDVATGKVLGTLMGHKNRVRDVAFSPDGRVLASAGDDQTIRLWDMASRQQIGLLSGHTGRVHDVEFSPDGKTLASASADKTSKLWTVERFTGKTHRRSGDYSLKVDAKRHVTDVKLLSHTSVITIPANRKYAISCAGKAHNNNNGGDDLFPGVVLFYQDKKDSDGNNSVYTVLRPGETLKTEELYGNHLPGKPLKTGNAFRELGSGFGSPSETGRIDGSRNQISELRAFFVDTSNLTSKNSGRYTLTISGEKKHTLVVDAKKHVQNIRDLNTACLVIPSGSQYKVSCSGIARNNTNGGDDLFHGVLVYYQDTTESDGNRSVYRVLRDGESFVTDTIYGGPDRIGKLRACFLASNHSASNNRGYCTIRVQKTEAPGTAESKAIERLRQIGVKITEKNGVAIEFAYGNSPKITDTDMALLESLGTLENVVLIGCSNVTNAGFAHLRHLPRLKQLNLSPSNIGDAGLASVKGMKDLWMLGLNGTRVTDAGLKHLIDNRKITVLYLNNTRITDEGLIFLEQMSDMFWMDLENTELTDVGLAHLEHMSKMKLLSLGHTGVTDAGLPRLQGFSNLELLALNKTAVTDAGITHLTKLASLKRLILNGTHVTDAGLIHLAQLKNLTELQLLNTRVTRSGVDSLRDALPKCEILYGENPSQPAADFSIYGKGASVMKWASTLETGSENVGLELDEQSRVKSVTMAGGMMTDEGLSHLKELKNVESLTLSYTYGCSSEGLRHVAHMTKVKFLRLWGNHNFSDGVGCLNGMTNVETLYLHKLRVNDENMKFVTGMKGCKFFQMTLNPTVTDAGIAHLAGLTELESIYLSCPRLTDECLEYFHGMNNLRSLLIASPHVTKAALQRLSRKLPNLKTVNREPVEKLFESNSGEEPADGEANVERKQSIGD